MKTLLRLQLIPLLGLLGLGLHTAALHAQTHTRSAQIYRCGPQGQDLRDTPCPAGAAASSATLRYTQPSAADQAAEQARVQRQERLTQDLVREREQLERESRRHPRTATALQTLPPPAQAASPAALSEPLHPTHAPRHSPRRLKPRTPSASSAR